jgi:hypothetical protein
MNSWKRAPGGMAPRGIIKGTQGPRVQLLTGLHAPRKDQPLCRRRPSFVAQFHAPRVGGYASGELLRHDAGAGAEQYLVEHLVARRADELRCNASRSRNRRPCRVCIADQFGQAERGKACDGHRGTGLTRSPPSSAGWQPGRRHQRPGSQVRPPAGRVEPLPAIQSTQAQAFWRSCTAFPKAGTLCISDASQRHAASGTTPFRFLRRPELQPLLSAPMRQPDSDTECFCCLCPHQASSCPNSSGLTALTTSSFAPILAHERGFAYNISCALSDHDDRSTGMRRRQSFIFIRNR